MAAICCCALCSQWRHSVLFLHELVYRSQIYMFSRICHCIRIFSGYVDPWEKFPKRWHGQGHVTVTTYSTVQTAAIGQVPCSTERILV